jgi:hypothetical protein
MDPVAMLEYRRVMVGETPMNESIIEDSAYNSIHNLGQVQIFHWAEVHHPGLSVVLMGKFL